MQFGVALVNCKVHMLSGVRSIQEDGVIGIDCQIASYFQNTVHTNN